MAEKEPEITGIDGTVRKAHYGEGRQPWDDIKDLGWAPHFAAGNALKYVRRHKAKNGADDLEKGRWYFQELQKMAFTGSANDDKAHRIRQARRTYDDLCLFLKTEEVELLSGS